MISMRIFSTVFAVSLAAPANAQSITNAVWATDSQNKVYRWDASRGEFTSMPGTMKQISVGADGEVWGIDPLNSAYRWTGTQWQAIPARLEQVSVRNIAEIWGINPDRRLFKRNGVGWDPIDTPNGIKDIAVGTDGSVWIVENSGNIARRESSSWVSLPCLVTSGVLRRSGTTWTITRSLEDPSPSPGVPCSGGSMKFRNVRVTDAQKVFGVTDSGHLARWTETGWYIFESTRTDLAYSSDGELWITNGQRLDFTPDQMSSWKRMLPYTVPFQTVAVGAASTQPSIPSLGASGLSLSEEQESLSAHNSERQNFSRFGVGSLVWSPELAKYAHDWAQTLANEGQMRHRPTTVDNPFRPNEYLGENIYGAASSGPVAVQSWAAEKQWYHYDQDNGMGGANQPPGCTVPPGKYCGHFTQVIWKNTQYVGCGRASSPNGSGYFICNYYPSGNYTGQKPY